MDTINTTDEDTANIKLSNANQAADPKLKQDRRRHYKKRSSVMKELIIDDRLAEIKTILIERRKELNATQAEIATKAGVARRSVVLAEKEGISLTVNTLIRILEVLGLELVIREKRDKKDFKFGFNYIHYRKLNLKIEFNLSKKKKLPRWQERARIVTIK